jgi:hypothetical protein
MRLRLVSAWSFAVATTLGLACGPASLPVAPTLTAKGVSSAPPAGPSVVTPSRWSLHATAGRELAFAIAIDEGTLYLGLSGDRWLASAGGVTAATTLARAPLVAVRKIPGGHRFIDEHGAAFESKEPLGALTPKETPREALRGVRGANAAGASAGSAVGQALIGIDAHDRLVRSTDAGATWNVVTTPEGPGTLAQVALGAGGLGLALFAPQRVLATLDDGATWQKVETPSVGARRVYADQNGDLILEGLIGAAALRASPSARLERLGRATSDTAALPVAPVAKPSKRSQAIHESHAAFDGARFYELLRDGDESEKRWSLASEELGGARKVDPRRELDGCDEARLDARGGVILVACARSRPRDPTGLTLALSRSVDGGRTWKSEAEVASAPGTFEHLWLTPEGGVLLQGAVKKTRNPRDAYQEGGPLVLVPGAKSPAKATTGGAAAFDAVAFSPNGKRAAALGRARGPSPALFVSDDGGRSFVTHVLPAATDAYGATWTPIHYEGTIAVDDEGTVVAFTAADQPGKVRSNARLVRYVRAAGPGTKTVGRMLAIEPWIAALSGRRAFAYDGAGRGWESADAGASWTEVAAPRHEEGTATWYSLGCGEYGCVLGDHATRIGWDLALAAPGVTGAAGSPSGSGAIGPIVDAPKPLRARTNVVCDVAPGEPLPLASGPLPDVADTEKGGGTRVVRPHLGTDGAASVVVVRDAAPAREVVRKAAKGDPPPPPRALEVATLPLFGPPGLHRAVRLASQVEGAAAMRYAFSVDAQGAPTPGQQVDVEVAWFLAATGKIHRATLKAVGPLDPAKDLDPGFASGFRGARSSMLTIAPPGIVVRPFASAGPDAPLWFIHENGKIEKLTFPAFPKLDARGAALSFHADATRIGNRTLLFGSAGGGAQVFLALANEAGSAWETGAWGLWPVDDEALSLYDGGYYDAGALRLSITHGGTPTRRAAGWGLSMAPEQGHLAPDPTTFFALPSQEDLIDPLPACGADSESWSRVLVPAALGTRRAVVVRGAAAGDAALLSEQLVARVPPKGSSKAACVAAVGAHSAGPGIDALRSALVVPADLEHSLLFESLPSPTADGRESVVRELRCRFEAGAFPASLRGDPRVGG